MQQLSHFPTPTFRHRLNPAQAWPSYADPVDRGSHAALRIALFVNLVIWVGLAACAVVFVRLLT